MLVWAGACVRACVHVCVCVCVRARALRIVSRDKILRFKNTVITAIEANMSPALRDFGRWIWIMKLWLGQNCSCVWRLRTVCTGQAAHPSFLEVKKPAMARVLIDIWFDQPAIWVPSVDEFAKQHNTKQCTMQCNTRQCTMQQNVHTINYITLHKLKKMHNAIQCNTKQIIIQCYTIQIALRHYKVMQNAMQLDINYNTMQHNVMQHNTIQCNTIQIAKKCNTIQHNAIKYNVI